ncbi:PREDICTED: subtilisin-like protease SBT1.4 [Nelumbo nucifera]|nr:PREDICTED: subtilisin-like protease SBT1.4 [Nelumbo nucifera]
MAIIFVQFTAYAIFTASSSEIPSTFIVLVSKTEKPTTLTSDRHWYTSLLTSIPFSSPKKPEILYTYEHAIHGLAAQLTSTQATELRKLPGVLSVLLGQTNHIHTTHSPDFLELSSTSVLWPSTDYGDDVIVGVIDTGIWPGHESFSDDGLLPVPSRWTGTCETSSDFPAAACNKKVIGARAFYRAYEARYGPMNTTVESKSPKDTVGHGTHVASTVAGYPVNDAGFLGYAMGVARGIAPKAKIAMYKACWLKSCEDADLLAALDQAIVDGVDVISMSVGKNISLPYYQYLMAIGTLRAVNKGDYGNRLCFRSSTLSSGVAGKIVLCDRGELDDVVKGITVKQAGGAGMILASTAESGPSAIANAHLLPATMVDQTAGDLIRNYIRSQPSPTAKFYFAGTVNGPDAPPAPQVAPFSSRGPNAITPEIIKPDLIAPGVNILAAWTWESSPTQLPFEIDPRHVKFNIISGTSMACPHVSALAAMLRKLYPQWSPAAVKSALMTTTINKDNSGQNIKDFGTGNDATPFQFGSGHVDAVKVHDPGLVYDMGIYDYIGFLCSIGYSSNLIANMIQDPTLVVNCATQGFPNPGYLNYPSFSVVFNSDREVVEYYRAVRNVGQSTNVVYVSQIYGPPSVGISVTPSSLVFNARNPILQYRVTFSSLAYQTGDTTPAFGWIVWTDGVHQVKSPVAFTWSNINPIQEFVPIEDTSAVI